MLVERKDSKNNRIVQEYVLPDFSSNKRGRIRDPDEMPVDNEQVLYMENERFSVPEVLFQPAYLGKLVKAVYSVPLISYLSPGLQQAGLASTIAQSIALLPEEIQGMFWANIGLIGGNCKLPGFSRRLCVSAASVVTVSSDRTIAGMSCDRWRLTTTRLTSTNPRSADSNILI